MRLLLRGGRCATAVVLLALGDSAAAESAADWTLSAGIVSRTLAERGSNGAKRVSEKGNLAHLGLRVGSAADGAAAWSFESGLAWGTLDYQGQTQAGAPLSTRTRHRGMQAALLWRPLAPATWGEGWLSLRSVREQRRIASTPFVGGLDETSVLWLPGLRWRSPTWAAAGWHGQAQLQAHASFSHRLHVDYLGVFDASTLEGGRRREWALGLTAGPADSAWRWSLVWTRTRQSASDAVPLYRAGALAGSVRQPRLEIDDLALAVTRVF